MNIAEEVKRRIRQELDAGATQAELAERYGLSQGNISRILSGKNTVSFDALERMFPNLRIYFDGGAHSVGCNSKMSNSTIQDNSNNFFAPASSGIDPELIKAAMEGMSPEEKARFLRELHKQA